jgi:putative DNA primase/helicase
MNSHTYCSDPVVAISENIASNGIDPPSTIFLDGEVHRFGKKKRYWYIAHQYPIPVCIYGDWKLGTKNKYIHHDSNLVAVADRLLVQKAIKALEKKRLEDKEQSHKVSGEVAQKLWAKAQPAMFHEYLKRKQVLPLGIKVDQHNNLLIPLMKGKVIQSLQFIQTDGTKRFLKGGKTKGMYYPIGLADQFEKLLICEGFATGVTLYMETKTPVIAAFYAANLAPVAKVIRKQHPHAEILICGDNDHATEGNPGKTYAINAARACGGWWTIPDFSGLNPTSKDTDFNDLSWLQKEAAL